MNAIKKWNTKRMDWAMGLVLLTVFIMFLAFIHLLQGSSPLKPSAYNTYTLQAMQWRKGEIALARDYPHLELAIFEGKYYVSFPPVPSVPIYFLSFIFGEAVPLTLLIQLYALLSCLVVYAILRRVFAAPAMAALWAFFIVFASSLLPMLQNGAVWYQAQVLAFLLIVAAIERIQKGKPTAGLFFFALSVGCRPFNVLYGPLLLAFALRVMSKDHHNKPTAKDSFRDSLLRLLPGLLLGLLAAAAYAWYNDIRFGSPFEFGHNYLPEFSTQGGEQFALGHLSKNIRTFLFGWPFEKSTNGFVLKRFGFSLFLANPIFLFLLFRAVSDGIKKQLTPYQLSVLLVLVLHSLGLLLHRTGGGFQYGARYQVDCIPYVLLYLAAAPRAAQNRGEGRVRPPSLPAAVLMTAGLAAAIFGAIQIHL